jgi:hypothetical protein
MLFKLFQTSSLEDDDIATGTYADGMVGTPLGDPLVGAREQGRSLHPTGPHAGQEGDYGMIRTAGQTGAGMVP